jgi:hypothetical protein
MKKSRLAFLQGAAGNFFAFADRQKATVSSVCLDFSLLRTAEGEKLFRTLFVSKTENSCEQPIYGLQPP